MNLKPMILRAAASLSALTLLVGSSDP